MSAFLQTSFDEMKTDKDSILFRVKIAKVSFFFALGFERILAQCPTCVCYLCYIKCNEDFQIATVGNSRYIHI